MAITDRVSGSTTAGGYTCSFCHAFVPNGLLHLCSSSGKPISTEKVVTFSGVDLSMHDKLDELLRMVRQRKNRQCFICGEERQCWTDMPYGSFYDGNIICGDCCAKYIDPLLDLIRVAKGESAEE